MGVIMAVKGLLLLFGAFIAVETRNIKMNLLNEAKEIALTIYTVLVLAGIGVPINFVVEKNIDFKYGVTSIFVILGTTVMLAACLFPKVYLNNVNFVTLLQFNSVSSLCHCCFIQSLLKNFNKQNLQN